MATEGNLQAPTRHALDWKNPDFHDEEKCFVELERIFDICHGCRRCVSLCGAFPTLFDLVDESSTMEVDGVAKADYWKVVDQCYMCDLCYMTKCPYTPPHEWNLDFPHTMLRAKAIKFKKGEVGLAERFLASTDVHGQFAGIPVVVQVANAVNKTRAMRSVMESVAGVDKDAWLPELATKKFRSGTPQATSSAVVDGEKTPGKVAIFSTCYINYNEPGIGLDLLKILNHNQIPYVIVEKEKCCGMPKLELGDLDSVQASKEANIPVLAKYAQDGYAILAAVPSCALMFKQEIPLMFPEDADVQLVKAHMWDPFEYFMARKRDGLLKTEFPQPLGNVSYQIPCHGRVQNIGRKTEEMLRMIPGTMLNTIERCSGHAGTFGVKKATHQQAMKIGKPVFKAMATMQDGAQPDFISSDCPLGGHHIAQGFEVNGLGAPELQHPLSLVAKAYGLK
ncbi:MAG: heterodisulfide reductase-related iron-sulfur binding cluster [Hydrogenophaga sp.]|jgi:Fe-S oxidoreductase|uniref:(Fe-S)-binding protein n=1 Tax=Hydrogenophaga sp. TaxID=1904254 RepID=UPI00272F3D6C|nr:heterodisulfide reductase-related iron-sulfur binding cluster [Hydrogenophaga sp.]MDP2407310.1 heterodisulfide reductase-related iron-sulfur binding cluster [Hydrogenophaga sp.]MDZ4174321.1 heterodisulfide reductase-related iron-sulfur binding cluster [Hydrogenophaga sp.]